MKGCYCGGDPTGILPVLYTSDNTLYTAVARCDCSNAFKDMGDPKGPRHPALLTIIQWKRRSDYYSVSVNDDETYLEAHFRAQNSWWHQNRERFYKRLEKSKPKELVRPDNNKLSEFLQTQKQLSLDNEVPDFVKEADKESKRQDA